MKHIVITVILILIACNTASAQWTKVYQTDSCHCSLFTRWPLVGMGFWGSDSGVLCEEVNGITALTLDGGMSWNAADDPNLTINFPKPNFGSNSSFLDINHIWLCNEALVHRTNDGGKSWELDTNKNPDAFIARCIFFVDTLIGFEGGPGIIYRTSDGGKNWDSVQVPGGDSSDFDVYQIQFCNPKIGLAICNDYAGLILRTTDSGITWALTTPPDWAQLGSAQSLSFPDLKDAWFADDFDIFHSTDTGSTWTRISGQIETFSSFTSISFLDSIHGIASANGSPSSKSLIRGYTSDGGKSWRTDSVDLESGGGFTSFPDLNTAYVGGYDAVYKLNVQDLGVQAAPIINSSLQIYPNPFTQSTQITFTSQSAGYAEVSVVNMLGVEEARLFSGELGAGEHSFTWGADGTSAPRGVYECLVRMNGQVKALPVVLMR